MTLRNYLPEPLRLKGTHYCLEPCGLIARVAGPQEAGTLQYSDGLNQEGFIKVLGMSGVFRQVYLYKPGNPKTYPFPQPEKEVVLVVSVAVRLALPHRHDLVNPGGYVKNIHGDVVSFQHFEAFGEIKWT